MQEHKEVILVDEQDRELGTLEKMEAHRQALLHRAFSVFIFNHKGEMLLQKRALNKYHSAGLWTNACCSHPAPNEDTAEAASKRLREEMGFSTPIEKIFDFVYKSPFENGLTEYEFDHVYVGMYDEMIRPNPEEVSDYCYKSIEEIEETLQMQPAKFTTWFRIAFQRVKEWANQHLSTRDAEILKQ